MSIIEIIKIITIIIALSICCYTDLRYQKIKNIITFPLILGGIIINIIELGFFSGFIFSLKGIVAMFFICLLVSIVGGFGFGDTKLLMGIASLYGFWFSFDTLLFSLLTMILFFVLFRFKYIKQGLKNLKMLVLSMQLRKELPTMDKKQSAWTVPFACFITLGHIISLLCYYLGGGNVIWNMLN